jgi:hypothetical protein
MDVSDFALYLTQNGGSKHVTPLSVISPANGREKWNENNVGAGLLGKKTDGDVIKSIGIGQYINSLGRNTIYGHAGRQKRLLGGDKLHLDLGGRAGLATGYNSPVVPIIQALLTLGGGGVDFNIGWSPHVPNVAPEVFTANVDYRLK